MTVSHNQPAVDGLLTTLSRVLAYGKCRPMETCGYAPCSHRPWKAGYAAFPHFPHAPQL